MVAELYRPEEAFRVQAMNEFILFSIVAIASFSSGGILVASGWTVVNLLVYPIVAISVLLIVCAGDDRPDARQHERRQHDRHHHQPGEIAKFAAMADEWWDPTGKFKPLHKFNPVRLAYIRDWALQAFRPRRDGDAPARRTARARHRLRRRAADASR